MPYPHRGARVTEIGRELREQERAGVAVETGPGVVIIGYTTGVFDLFHVGHARVLNRSREQCDHLIVGVTTDELAISRKGRPPVIPFDERIEIVRALRCVDEVVPQASMDKMAAWRSHAFHRMFVGDDWRGTPTWRQLEAQFAEVGVEIVYFPYTQHTSSTMLRRVLTQLDKFSSTVPQE